MKRKLSSNWKIKPDYTIVKGDGFAKQVKEVFDSVERWEELFRSYVWALKRDPQQFDLVHPVSRARILKLGSANSPTYGLYFRVKKNIRQVVLKWIEEIPSAQFNYDEELFWSWSDS